MLFSLNVFVELKRRRFLTISSFLRLALLKFLSIVNYAKFRVKYTQRKTTSYQQKDFFSHLKNDKNRKLLLQDDSLLQPCYALATLINKSLQEE